MKIFLMESKNKNQKNIQKIKKVNKQIMPQPFPEWISRYNVKHIESESVSKTNTLKAKVKVKEHIGSESESKT